MPLFCARLLVVVLVEGRKPRKRNTCDYPFVIVKARDNSSAFKRALKLGQAQEHRYQNDKGQWVRWAFVRVEHIWRLEEPIEGKEVGSMMDVLESDAPLSFESSFNPGSSEPTYS
ncbi:DUF4288 domain-containing protein [Caenimonas aquaedulcis]|uniref:DUF4288 domain-containing protein n=1 Tax=Caenimonas aquaedulcis TaxID=2793270 RepID=A0A931H7S0_9BURK|nr:DUF4288 domain-containing protein [Caenimonas aquaedulcis]